MRTTQQRLENLDRSIAHYRVAVRGSVQRLREHRGWKAGLAKANPGAQRFYGAEEKAEADFIALNRKYLHRATALRRALVAAQVARAA